MALGGGIWTVQNKTLPGAYINFSSVSKASATLSDRGYAAVPLLLDWGPENAVITVTGEDFRKDSLKIFGRTYDDPYMLPLREIFRYTRTLYAYRINSGGTKAENAYCTARYGGTGGNRLYTVIAKNADEPDTLFDVSTYFGSTRIDAQTVAKAADLLPNEYVTWKTEAELAETAKTPLANGTDGNSESAAWQKALDKFESYSFNTLGCPTADPTITKLFVNYTKRMRDEVGAKFQTVVYNPQGSDAVGDYEGIIAVGNKVVGFDGQCPGMGEFGLVYWLTGASAGCAVNKSNTNKRYDGELTVNVDYTQTELETGIKTGRLMLHNANGEVRVLEDLNSLTTLTDTKGADFQSNQTIRVCDQIANDVAQLFATRYLGVVPNDASGRISLWNDVCKLYEELETIRAIENFDSETVTVEQGETKKSVVCNVSGLNIINAMSQLYMTVVVA